MTRKVQPLIFISAELAELSTSDNINRTKHLESMLLDNGLKYKTVKGRYSGRDENSFMVYNSDTNTLPDVNAMANYFDQETILIRHKDETCNLVGVSTTSDVYLGRLLEVDAHTAQLQDNYSVIDNRYFTTER